MTTDTHRLVEAATAVRSNAHAPYSGFHVGAAVQDEHGVIHVGCNVENAAFPEGACAEANAIGAMVAGGGKRIVAIAVVGGPGEVVPCAPCGGCRQRILEFSDDNTQVVLIGDGGSVESHRISDLLPTSFRL
jgi:cytidine deaminase